MIQKYYSKNAHTGVGGKDKAYTSPVVFLDITTPTRTAMLYESAGSTSPMSTNLQVRRGCVLHPSQCFHTPLFWLETSIVITPTGDTQSQTRMVTSYKTGRRATISTSSMTPNSEAPSARLGGTVTIHLTYAGSQPLVVIPSQPHAQSWMIFPTANTARL